MCNRKNNLNLLYVEGNNIDRDSISSLLSKLYHNITLITAKNEEEGFQKYLKNNIDLLITDIYMPKVNGFTMIEKIKKLDNTLPIIIISSCNHSEYLMQGIKYKVDSYLLKPISLKQLEENSRPIIEVLYQTKLSKEHDHHKLATIKMIKNALESYNIVSYFQPIVNNKTKKIEKYESLVRLIDGENNVLPPSSFLETAKESKLYRSITSIVLENSFKALYQTKMNITINLSTIDIEEKETNEKFFHLLYKHQTQAHRIIVELVEDEKAKSITNIQNFMNKIKSFGVKVAIDDFGTGLSNFTRILCLKPDIIKIDGGLIRDIESNELARSMVETIVIFAKKVNIITVAEYVENEKIFDILCNLGVDYSQGYYFGKAELLTETVLI